MDRKKYAVIVGVLIVVIVVALNIFGYFYSNKNKAKANDGVKSEMNITNSSDNGDITPQNKFEVRNKLLLEALDYVGVCSAEKALDVWSEGLKQRSGALQMSVMSPKLRKKYISKLEEFNEFWVTGISSPYVESYKILNTKTPDDKTKVFEVLYQTATSTGPAQELKATVTVTNNEDLWQITKIDMEKGLYPYAGLQD